MFSIKNNNISNNNFDHNNCIFSIKNSRPSKSLIDCELYKEFSKLNNNLEIFDEFSYLKHQSKNKEYFLLREVINKFELYNIDTDNLTISYDNIIINEISIDNITKFNIIFCFDYDISIRNIIINLLIIFKELENNDCLLINFDNLYNYPSSELLLILSNLFSKIKIYYCKLLKQNIIYCYNYIHNKFIIVFFKNIIKNWNKNYYIRQFGVFIEDIIQKKIKKHNNFILTYYINLNNNFANSSLEDKEYFFKNYIKKKCKLINNFVDCNHEIKEFNLFNCFICNKCYELFMIY